MSSGSRPRLFIGSSVEGLDVAYGLQENLEYDAEPTVWPQGVFNPTASTLASLVRTANETDFAAFVFTPDDVRIIREQAGKTPRDNVVFELGLMIGARGPDRCFFVMPSDDKLSLPTDLLGLTPLTYVSNRQDGNVVAALGRPATRSGESCENSGPYPLLSREATHPHRPTQRRRLQSSFGGGTPAIFSLRATSSEEACHSTWSRTRQATLL